MDRFMPAIMVAIGALLGMACFLPNAPDAVKAIATLALLIYIVAIIVWFESEPANEKE